MKQYYEKKELTFTQLAEKLKKKKQIVEQKEQEIVAWENSHLFKDMIQQREEMRKEFENFRLQKDLFQQQLIEKEAVLSKKQLETTQKEAVIQQTLESLRIREQELLKVETSINTTLPTMPTIFTSVKPAPTTLLSSTYSAPSISAETHHLSPIQTTPNSEENKFLLGLKKEQEEIEQLKEQLMKQSSEIQKAQGDLRKAKKDNTFWFKYYLCNC